jgi:CRP-like cAMP-binding protein
VEKGNLRGFLGELTPREAAALEACGRRINYSTGQTLFFEGQAPDHVLLLQSGRVKIFSTAEDGREVLLSITGPGDILGEISAVDGERRSATALAIEPVVALKIPSKEFRSFLVSHPRVALLIIRMVAGRLRAADRRRIEFAAFDSVGRVASLLVELTERHGEATSEGIRITLPLSQSEIAGWTGSSREAVSKALQMLRRRGWIKTHRRGITVIDVEALRTRDI